MEIKTEADSNDITECPDDNKATLGMLGFSDITEKWPILFFIIIYIIFIILGCTIVLMCVCLCCYLQQQQLLLVSEGS